MKRERKISVSRFLGVADNVTEAELDEDNGPALHQDDQGGNHEVRGIWGTRRGIEDTGFSKKATSVLAVAGFETLNGDIAYASVAGTELHDGELAVGTSGANYGGPDYGASGYGG